MKKSSLLLLALGACANADDKSSFDTPDAAQTADAGPGSFVTDAAPPDFQESNVECAEETKQVYVLGADKTLYRFDPPTLKLTSIGTLGCASAAGTFSMAIDRFGTAFVEYTDGNLFAVDTRTAACKATAFQAGQTGFSTFGMGYSLNGDALNGETLYVSGAGLAALDTKTFQLAFKGSIALGRTELTGQGPQLFAFGVSSGTIVELDKSNGATKQTYRTSAIDGAAAFAFAQWGGDFYVFTGEDHSMVTRYTPGTDVSTVVLQNAGILIVGAGSSTCAPSKPPS